MIELKRIAKTGFLNFARGGMVSFAAVLTMTITLSVITSIILLQAVLYSSLEQIKNKVDVTIYFHVGAPEEDIFSLQDFLSRMPEVASVSYTSAEEALRIFRERHASDYATLAALDEIGENPLGGYLNVRAKEISQYENIANFLGGDSVLAKGAESIIDKVDYHQNKLVIDRLNALIGGAQRLGFLITLVLVIISIVVVFNTIRLAIFISKEEIGVMQLVGASRIRVHGPFMVEGVIYGALSTLFTLAIFYPATMWLGERMSGFFGMNIYEYYLSNFFQLGVMILFSGMLLGVVSSFIAVRKYLNK